MHTCIFSPKDSQQTIISIKLLRTNIDVFYFIDDFILHEILSIKSKKLLRLMNDCAG